MSSNEVREWKARSDQNLLRAEAAEADLLHAHETADIYLLRAEAAEAERDDLRESLTWWVEEANKRGNAVIGLMDERKRAEAAEARIAAALDLCVDYVQWADVRRVRRALTGDTG